ncbi:response regulator [bacterium]|nr:response regulator [bacterium]
MNPFRIHKVLVVDDDAMIRRLVARTLMPGARQVIEAGDGEEGLACFREARPDAVLSDIVMPRTDGLAFLRQIRQIDPGVPAVVMTGESTEERAITAARLGVVDYLLKPFEMSELTCVMERLERLAWLRAHPTAGDLAELAVTDRIELRLDNDLPAAHKVLDRLFALVGVDDGDLMVGVLEVVLNAIEHGNLELGHEYKSRLESVHDYNTFLVKRARMTPYRDRRARISMSIDGDVWECVVEDEGSGFDWRARLASERDANFTLHHGRGVLLAHALFDEFEYNDKGNRVRMLKRGVERVRPRSEN